LVLREELNMENGEICFRPIGVINTPHTDLSKMPIQPVYAGGIRGTVTVYTEYTEGLKDLDGFSHIYLLYWFHQVKDMKLTVTPYLDDSERGVFATRAPGRPNPIGLSLVKVLSIEKNVIYIEDVDMLDGTPLLDIKPFAPRFESREQVRSGWLDTVDERTARIRGRRQDDKE
jgi:tRNA-Thr(GGU) m(6)t(6)A37 methyltransferase TsaA